MDDHQMFVKLELGGCGLEHGTSSTLGFLRRLSPVSATPMLTTEVHEPPLNLAIDCVEVTLVKTFGRLKLLSDYLFDGGKAMRNVCQSHVPLIEELLATTQSAVGKVHALCALDGLNAINLKHR